MTDPYFSECGPRPRTSETISATFNGFDLDSEIPLNHDLERKVRRAAETGSPFIRVRDLFPH